MAYSLRKPYSSGRVPNCPLRIIVPAEQLFEELLELIGEDADALDCRAEVEHVREILAHGTSAHRQLAVHEQAIAGGATQEEAERAVVDHLIERTAKGTA